MFYSSIDTLKDNTQDQFQIVFMKKQQKIQNMKSDSYSNKTSIGISFKSRISHFKAFAIQHICFEN